MAVVDSDRRNRHPRMLTDNERERLDEYVDSIHYSSRYTPHRYHRSYFAN